MTTPVSTLRGNKSGRRISPDTETYKLFEKLFIELPLDSLPYSLDMSKGQAINLAMGLNRCHIQWAEDNGVPSEYIERSAKARQPAEGSSQWRLEISLNQRHTRISKRGWISSLGENLPERQTGEQATAPEAPEAPDASELLLAQLYGKKD